MIFAFVRFATRFLCMVLYMIFFGQHVRVRSNLFGCSKFYKSFQISRVF
ncbi:hypothetical protein CJ212_06550 [Gardnerella vaginalis]|nr:hypothetical protein HMPREF1575_01405 [Gardnerella vaginalis JCP7672]PMC50378.1 hypothetical protein CJ212_06550 [Gardnerella vaginalis]RFT37447.1 hypothetical protein CG397_08355 [Gardnerella vaginalis]